jgi:hypothetical protein
VPRSTGSIKIGDPVSVIEQRPEGWPVRLR